MKKIAFAIATTALAFGMASGANAGIVGSAYFVSEAQASNAVIGFAHGAANATFSVPNGPIDFNSAVGGYTLGGFLGSSPGEITLTGSAADLARNIDIPGAGGLILELMGTVSLNNGQSFTVRHDDGLQLMIGALLVVDVPGPTSEVLTTYTWTGASGTYAFDLVYGECCGAPARLATSLPLVGTVPEPGTLALAGLALAGLGVARRRKQ